MLAEFIVMFRESLEVAFVIGIMLAYLHQTKNEEHEKHIWLGLSTGIVLSIALAFGFQFVQGGFRAAEELFEGIFMIIISILVTWLILWIVAQKNIVEGLRQDVRVALEKKQTTALFLLALSATMREGVEAILFMAGIYVSTGTLSLIAGFLGIAAAVVIGILVFEYAIRFNISLFFRVTAAILILLAAGLFSQGLHELQEAKILPTWIKHVYDINPPKNLDGSYPLLHEKGQIGSLFKGLIGYDGNPSDLQVMGYVIYVLGVGIYYYNYSYSKAKDKIKLL